MKRLCYLVLLLLLSLVQAGFGQRDAWLPLTEQDKSIKDIPESPGTDSVLLYYAQEIDDNSQNDNAEWNYLRIKILTEKGKDRADGE